MRHWLAILICGTLGLAAGATEVSPAAGVNAQVIADGARWAFMEDQANPLWCAAQPSDYIVRLSCVPHDRPACHIEVCFGERVVAGWRGHGATVFAIHGDLLSYADFNPGSDGGTIVAVDLNTGTTRWTSPLIGLGGVAHSAYRTRLTIAADAELVSIRGDESAGSYLELKDVHTGITCGHRVFARGYGAARQVLPALPASRATMGR